MELLDESGRLGCEKGKENLSWCSFGLWLISALPRDSAAVDLKRGLLSMFVLGNFAAPTEGLMISAHLLSIGAVARGS